MSDKPILFSAPMIRTTENLPDDLPHYADLRDGAMLPPEPSSSPGLTVWLVLTAIAGLALIARGLVALVGAW